MRLLIVGNRGGTNIGESFARAAEAQCVEVRLLEAQRAMRAPALVRRFNWWLRGRRPSRLGAFGVAALAVCREWPPDVVLATGSAPLSRPALRAIRASGAAIANYLTDDPWNPAHRAPWFLRALPCYTSVFTPRRANIADLLALGCRDVRYLPFGYDPALHFPDPPLARRTDLPGADDAIFVGGGERERAQAIGALLRADIRVGLYGDLWERFASTRHIARGPLDVQALRTATGAAKVALCLVRHANRDGHVMRSFEIAAIGACMLVEDTAEHRAIFGAAGEAVVYFATPAQMVERLRWLLACPAERARLAAAAQHLITAGGNTYGDRLDTILRAVRPTTLSGALCD